MNSALISGKTQVCGVIGNPIEHTLSPIMQNAAFREAGLDFVYIPFKVMPEDIAEAVQGIRAFNIKGLNVTIPHKVSIIPYLDEVDEIARHIEAINTIVNQDGCLKGYNTDASGFLKALVSSGIDPARKKIVILGAGGASRAVSFTLADKGANLTIVNRHIESATGLAQRIEALFRKNVTALEMTHENLENTLADADILINTTSVGMSPGAEETLVPKALINKKMVVVDIVYNPLTTRLLREAAERGAKVVCGADMLIWQGAVAFEKWTGQKAPVEVMKKALMEALERYEN